MNTFELMDFISEATSEIFVESRTTDKIFLAVDKSTSELYFAAICISQL